MSDVPDWLVDLIQETRRLLGVGDDWCIAVRMADAPGNGKDYNAACYVCAVYLDATLEFARDIKNDEEGQRLVMHEVMHVAHAAIDRDVEHALAGLPKRERKRFARIYKDDVERFLQRVTRAMVSRVKPIEIERGDRGER